MNPQAAQLLSILEQRKIYLDFFKKGIHSLKEKSLHNQLSAPDVLSFGKSLKDIKLDIGGITKSMWRIEKINYIVSPPTLYVNSKEGHFKYKGSQLSSDLQKQILKAINNNGIVFPIEDMNVNTLHIGTTMIDKNQFILDGIAIDHSNFNPKKYDASMFGFEIKEGDDFFDIFTIVDTFIKNDEEKKADQYLRYITEKYNNQVIKELNFYAGDVHSKDLEFIKCLASESCDCSAFE